MEQALILYNLRPTAAQLRTTSLVALLGLAAFLAILPFGSLQLARVDSFIPAGCAALLLADWVTATLLLVQASLLRSKPLIALGTGYFFTGLMLIPTALAFPGAFSPTGLLGAAPDTPVWIYIFWHCGLPLSVIAYVSLRHSPDWLHTASLSPRKAIAICLIVATALAGALTVLASACEALLPRLMQDHSKWSPDQALVVTGPPMLLVAGAMAIIWRGRSSVLDRWLLLVLWAWFLELLLTTLTNYRFSLGWYSGRILGLLSGLFVLLLLLAETNKLYAQTVLRVRAGERERENRLMIRDAITASIVHELRQPLTAIMLNAQAGQRSVPKPDGAISSILDEIVSNSHRASGVIESTRAIFGKSSTQKIPTDMNQLVRDTLAIIARDLRDLDVSVDLRLDNSLPQVAAIRLQMQQVFCNLFMNGAEAMSSVMDRPRLLTIRSGSGDHGLVITIEDTGPGIAAADQDRIFGAFFTTKTNGTGLGLSICRSVITAHGGWVRAATQAPIGAMFEIYLPQDGGTGADFIRSQGARDAI